MEICSQICTMVQWQIRASFLCLFLGLRDHCSLAFAPVLRMIMDFPMNDIHNLTDYTNPEVLYTRLTGDHSSKSWA